MIQIKNKKKTLKITVEEMKNLSLSYIEKYSPSRQQIKTYLLKKYLKLSISSIKNYFKYLINNDLISIDPTKVIEVPKQSKKIPL